MPDERTMEEAKEFSAPFEGGHSEPGGHGCYPASRQSGSSQNSESFSARSTPPKWVSARAAVAYAVECSGSGDAV